ncbi:pseudouridine synthase [Sodalinema gerasimenkoae]|uniref:pseudouridine synthase n=1 Tax=Sodalinema gerasimenkoae TaxID=2862348 RepID=UPI001FE6253D|nr:pseudouridine synthase [Sodalinema gerasimenkoae]
MSPFNVNVQYRYILFYKPYDVLCQFTDNSATPRATLKDYIPIPGVYSVGRLDRDSEGLLLLTNDGPLKHRLTDPKFAKPRTYWVQVERTPDEAALEALRRGVMIRGYTTRPAQVQRLPNPPDLPPRDPPIRYRKTVPTDWLEITLTEGRNRQVRRMTAAVGFPTLRLIRVRSLRLTLEGLQPGQWRELTPLEIQQVREDSKEQSSSSRSTP